MVGGVRQVAGEAAVRAWVALAQVLTMFARLSRDRGSVTGRMSCAPWQS